MTEDEHAYNLFEILSQIPYTKEMRTLAEEDSDGALDLLGYDYNELDRHIPTVADDFQNWYAENNWIPYSSLKATVKAPLLPFAIYSNDEVRHFFEQVPVDFRDKLVSILNTTQIGIHLRRIWTTPRSPELSEFAISFMRYSLAEDPEDILALLGTSIPASSDGNAALKFWTLAPYVYQALRKLDLTQARAFNLLFFWSKSRHQENGDAAYPGLGKIEEIWGDRFWYLTSNVSDQTHKQSRMVAKELARQLAEIGSNTTYQPLQSIFPQL